MLILCLFPASSAPSEGDMVASALFCPKGTRSITADIYQVSTFATCGDIHGLGWSGISFSPCFGSKFPLGTTFISSSASFQG